MRFRIFKCRSVKSTNDEAIKMIKREKSDAGIICSKKQSKGRGTMGKTWVSTEGNIFLTVFFQIKDKDISFADFSILNPYIMKSVLKKFSKYKITIKWPNDLLIKNKKFSGILQEVIEFKNKKYLIIGIGINTFTSPINKNFKSTSLIKHSRILIKNEDIIDEIKNAYEKSLLQIKKYKVSYLKRNIMRF